MTSLLSLLLCSPCRIGMIDVLGESACQQFVDLKPKISRNKDWDAVFEGQTGCSGSRLLSVRSQMNSINIYRKKEGEHR